MKPRELLIYLALKFEGDYHRILEAINSKEFDDIEEEPPSLTCKTLTILDDEYPTKLREYPTPPFVLFYYGDISLIQNIDKNLAVIGSRVTTEYGSDSTKEIVASVAKEVNIVSGLARGIDAIAQTQCIRSGGKTIAILGSGINYCYPEINQPLYEEIKKNHLVLSEYPGLTPPSPDKFPVRNRLIAMLSNTILVTEAYARSGTSITVNFGLQFSKNVCCIPYMKDRFSLCNKLIGQGAYLVETGDDVLEIMGITREQTIFDLWKFIKDITL